jgi:hypothetical protein
VGAGLHCIRGRAVGRVVSESLLNAFGAGLRCIRGRAVGHVLGENLLNAFGAGPRCIRGRAVDAIGVGLRLLGCAVGPVLGEKPFGFLVFNLVRREALDPTSAKE